MRQFLFIQRVYGGVYGGVCRALTLVVLLAFFPGCASQKTFDTPDLAASSLVEALRAGNEQKLREILGPDFDLLSSGDTVADENNVEDFVAEYDERHWFLHDGASSVTLIVGGDDWPMPIPIIRDPGKQAWRFDTATGKEELINRRIGRNELDAIQTCLAIMDAQREYAIEDPDNDGVPSYAQKIISDPGHKNGLFWEAKEGEKPSPLGKLVADAAAEGYTTTANKTGAPRPYHGYCYRILHSQGDSAEGGARDYMIGNNMIGGFAIIAYPVEYGSSGIMTFIMNQDGIVYQRDLGTHTQRTASSISSYDPGPEWEQTDDVEPDEVPDQ